VSNELALYGKCDSFEEMMKMGDLIAKSGMCGATNAQQGAVILMTCIGQGITPGEFGRLYHVIQGRPAMRADAMAAEYRKAGGKYKILQNDQDGASVELTCDDNKMVFSLAWEQAQKEMWPWTGKDRKTLKDNWSTPEGRAAMMWARVISRGVRRMMPEIVAGTYTPEEMEDIPQKEVKPKVSDEDFKAAQERLKKQKPDDLVVDQVVSAEVTTNEPEAPAKPPAEEPRNEVEEAFESITPTQIDRIKNLYETIPVPADKQAAALERRKIKSLDEIGHEDAKDMIARLEGLAAKKGKK
jgi:hypothetical protein